MAELSLLAMADPEEWLCFDNSADWLPFWKTDGLFCWFYEL